MTHYLQFMTWGIDWDTHIHKEHNMWQYINLFYYLNNTKKTAKLSAIEAEVKL